MRRYGPVQWKDLGSFPGTGKGSSLEFSAKGTMKRDGSMLPTAIRYHVALRTSVSFSRSRKFKITSSSAIACAESFPFDSTDLDKRLVSYLQEAFRLRATLFYLLSMSDREIVVSCTTVRATPGGSSDPSQLGGRPFGTRWNLTTTTFKLLPRCLHLRAPNEITNHSRQNPRHEITLSRAG